MKIYFISLFSCLLALTATASESISFASLAKGSQIKVNFTSSGCFHFVESTLIFSGVDPTTVKIVEKGLAPTIPDPKEIKSTGIVQINNNDLKHLNALLEFYRTNKDEGCTTTDSIQITLIKEGKVIAQEKYRDGSCGTYDRKDLLAFPAIISRMRDTKAQQGAAANP